MLGSKSWNIDFQMKINIRVAESKQIWTPGACATRNSQSQSAGGKTNTTPGLHGSRCRTRGPRTFTSMEFCPRCPWVFINIKFSDSSYALKYISQKGRTSWCAVWCLRFLVNNDHPPPRAKRENNITIAKVFTICCCCSVAKLCPTLCNPMDCSTPAFPVLYHPLESAQIYVHWVSYTI